MCHYVAHFGHDFLFARSQRGFVAGCGMALGDGGPVRLDMEHFSPFSVYGYQGLISLEAFSSSVNRFGGRYLSQLKDELSGCMPWAIEGYD